MHPNPHRIDRVRLPTPPNLMLHLLVQMLKCCLHLPTFLESWNNCTLSNTRGCIEHWMEPFLPLNCGYVHTLTLLSELHFTNPHRRVHDPKIGLNNSWSWLNLHRKLHFVEYPQCTPKVTLSHSQAPIEQSKMFHIVVLLYNSLVWFIYKQPEGSSGASSFANVPEMPQIMGQMKIVFHHEVIVWVLCMSLETMCLLHPLRPAAHRTIIRLGRCRGKTS